MIRKMRLKINNYNLKRNEENYFITHFCNPDVVVCFQ